MSLDLETKRLIFAIKQNYYDPRAAEKYLNYAPNHAYSQYLDLLYQVCAFLVGHHHPGQLKFAETCRFLDNPVIAQKAEEVMPLLKSDVLARLAEIHGSQAGANEAYEALVKRLMEALPREDET